MGNVLCGLSSYIKITPYLTVKVPRNQKDKIYESAEVSDIQLVWSELKIEMKC